MEKDNVADKDSFEFVAVNYFEIEVLIEQAYSQLQPLLLSHQNKNCFCDFGLLVQLVVS